MKKITVALLALAMALAITPSAKADSILNGNINVSAGNDFWSATSITFPNNQAIVLDANGAFSVIPKYTPGIAVINPGSFTFASPNGLLFTVTSGANVGTFTVAGFNVTLNNATTLNYNGWGWLTLTGYPTTYAVFTGSSTDSSGNYGTGIASSSAQFNVLAEPTPEPGSLLLLGSGMLGLAVMLRRKFMLSR